MNTYEIIIKGQAALKYVHRIRNKVKRDYAWAYFGFIFQGGPYPERPDGLSYMTVQAVQLAFDDIIDGKL